MTKVKFKFNLGQTVYLKSGSPKMTIILIDAEDTITVIWFGFNEATAIPHTATFPSFALKDYLENTSTTKKSTPWEK